jgi:hypothetical protein
MYSPKSSTMFVFVDRNCCRFISHSGTATVVAKSDQMAEIDLVHPNEVRRISVIPLMEKCTLFKTTLSLLGCPYQVKSQVSVPAFREFVSALEGKCPEITSANVEGLSLLCDEFGFEALTAQLLSISRLSAPSDADARVLICELDSRVLESARELSASQAEVGR